MSAAVPQELENLKKRIADAKIPQSTPNNLRLLTWNIRNLNGNKEDKAITYIAEVCKNFDIIAIQEAKDDLGGLEQLQRELKIGYRFLFSDTAGNSERLVFVYNQNKVQFTGLAAEVVMDPGAQREEKKKPEDKNKPELEKKKPEEKKPELEFDRTPFMASFRINGCNFILVTVHIYYGSGQAVKYRLEEIQNIAKYLKKASTDTDALDSDYIICGDFNIQQVHEEIAKTVGKTTGGTKEILKQLFGALISEGLIIPEKIQNSPSNLDKTNHLDQIGYQHYDDSTIEFKQGGVIDFVGAVYIGDPKLEYKMTDHLPMWAEFSTSKDKNPKYINP